MVPLPTEFVVRVGGGLTQRRSENLWAIRCVDHRAGGHHTFWCALGQHLHRRRTALFAGAARQHADQSPLEVERQLGALLIRRDGRMIVRQDRGIERAPDAALQRAVDACPAKHVPGLRAEHVHTGLQGEGAVGKCAGLVAT